MRNLLFIIIIFSINYCVLAQCNEGLNLGSVIFPTHANASNSGNFSSVPAWQESAEWFDSLNLDYRQEYIVWDEVVSQIASGVPQFSNYFSWDNLLSTWSGNPDVHMIYEPTRTDMVNTLHQEPPGFVSIFPSLDPYYFSDTAFVNQNYLAIKHILQNVDNIKWISVGNEIDTYFRGSYWSTGRLTRFTAFLDTIRIRMNLDGFSNIKLGTIVSLHNLTWSSSYEIIDSIRSHIDYVGYTFYHTAMGPPNDTCWGDPSNFISLLDVAKTKAGNKPMMLSETCIGDGGGVFQHCGSPIKQQSYVDTLLNWYNNDTLSILGMTWFTLVDPYLGWIIPSSLWNNGGLIDSNGIDIQEAGKLWQHNCNTTSYNDNYLDLNDKKKVEEIVDVLGRKSKRESNILLFYIYDDGTVEKRIILE